MKLVISAVNLVEGGTLTVLREVVRTMVTHFPEWEVIVAVHRVGIVPTEGVHQIAFATAKTSWLKRIWLEWFGFRRLSLEWKPDVWLSLHDITPRVVVRRQYVYCHNPAPFCKTELPLVHLEPKFQLFRRFYGILYGCFIQRNDAVIVQQDWLREEFQRRYKLSRVIVAHPREKNLDPAPTGSRGAPRQFLYPAFPRVFKNFELLGECVKLLEANRGWQGEILVTIDGSENAYAREMLRNFGGLRTLRFVGLQSTTQMEDRYQQCDALVFPSLLETWGLPISEAKLRGIPVLVADLPYAREAVGNCEQARFFDAHDAQALASLILALHCGTEQFDQARFAPPSPPFAKDWRELLVLLLETDNNELVATTPSLQR